MDSTCGVRAGRMTPADILALANVLEGLRQVGEALAKRIESIGAILKTAEALMARADEILVRAKIEAP